MKSANLLKVWKKLVSLRENMSLKKDKLETSFILLGKENLLLRKWTNKENPKLFSISKKEITLVKLHWSKMFQDKPVSRL